MRRFVAFTAVVLLAGCTTNSGLVPNSTAGTGQAAPDRTGLTAISSLGSQKIKHVIIVVQENRTLDNLFHGYPGADTVSTGVTHTGAVVPLTPGHLEEYYDLGHAHANFETEYD
ncbi:MAG: hypothetical protein JO029_00930, partial [Candidatus Eremiobacteraeota bacterium]|nr:hypothetical protein [Candidatus Eremiobacteraeota bacterium]